MKLNLAHAQCKQFGLKVYIKTNIDTKYFLWSYKIHTHTHAPQRKKTRCSFLKNVHEKPVEMNLNMASSVEMLL